ncbi:MAG: hypothetical protein FWG83_01165 [Oscillospiraceae bacterium]|nr:hypothetical protein [Oscillospiraceae bacterium]
MMIYHTDDMTLYSVRSVFKSEINDVVVCQDRASPAKPYYTLVVVKKRETAKKLLSIFEENPKSTEESPFVKCFSHGEELCYLFDYHIERNLEQFCEGQLITPNDKENICINIVLACFASPLPYPLLHLILSRRQVHIEKDNAIYFTHYFDLSELDPKNDEAQCTFECVRILLEILQKGSKKPLKSYNLLRKKIDRHSYKHFAELYRDIKITALPHTKPKLFQRFRNFWSWNKDRFFKIILVISVLAAILALLMLASYLIFGDFSLFRLFRGSIDKIGTEQINLTKS